ncbi:MAG: N-methyl-L-tryptophan oxidase [Chloroflexota bacterium]|nr:N-methyl-L-tryptophan oxidase [Chloroflexota bacterium]MDE2931929.1 N-methyl-L-tryptophan oxidase [Chloroflexota bacterium]
MKAEHFDTIVVGVGGMGSAAVHHLARRGERVLGLEHFDIPHDMGSSHGVTRVIRLTYFEHPSYVPLLARAYALWRELEQDAGEQLLYITGSIDAGAPDSFVVKGSIESCAEHDLTHDVLSSAELTQQFPGFALPPEMMGVWQPDGGFLVPERCIVHHVWQAQAAGAEVRAREPVLDWQAKRDSVTVRTTRATYAADRLVFTAGAWSQSLLPTLGGNAVPERQVMGWFQPAQPELFAVERFPVFNCLVPEGHYYGFPIHGIPGFKIGKYHHLQQQTTAESVDRECHREDEEALRACTQRYLTGGMGATLALKTCMFTNTPDGHFIMDHHPEHGNVVIAAGFSGHGFKFCSVVGEILADLALGGKTRHDIGMFGLGRFGAQ